MEVEWPYEKPKRLSRWVNDLPPAVYTRLLDTLGYPEVLFYATICNEWWKKIAAYRKRRWVYLHANVTRTINVFNILALEDSEQLRVDELTPFLKAQGERFLAKGTFKELVKEQTWTLILTERTLYKNPQFETINVLTMPRKGRPLLGLHSVVADPSDVQVFYIRSYKSKTKLAYNQAKGSLGMNMSFDSFLQVRQYVTQGEQQREQWVWLLNRAMRNEWQRLLESKLIPSPEIYQIQIGRAVQQECRDRSRMPSSA
eukprot:TRINITY_DN28935_c0_g1_i6.p1 TRINITY_DN28935_c0_g1~~TRINITY_DN28935_c0_g1_i6.p1  ORF type:complete len:257 (+),score=34.75 TRINITY_DN28935_c0_g1_i6:90-860(+)